MKKFITTCALSVLLILPMQNAQALIVGFTPQFISVTHAVITLGMIPTAVFFFGASADPDSNLWFPLRAVSTAIGILLLDEEGNQLPQLVEINSEYEALLIENNVLNKKQINSFNRDIEELNVVYQEVLSQVAQGDEEGAVESWSELQQYVAKDSVEAMKTLLKIQSVKK